MIKIDDKRFTLQEPGTLIITPENDCPLDSAISRERCFFARHLKSRNRDIPYFQVLKTLFSFLFSATNSTAAETQPVMKKARTYRNRGRASCVWWTGIAEFSNWISTGPSSAAPQARESREMFPRRTGQWFDRERQRPTGKRKGGRVRRRTDRQIDSSQSLKTQPTPIGASVVPFSISISSFIHARQLSTVSAVLCSLGTL